MPKRDDTSCSPPNYSQCALRQPSGFPSQRSMSNLNPRINQVSRVVVTHGHSGACGIHRHSVHPKCGRIPDPATGSSVPSENPNGCRLATRTSQKKSICSEGLALLLVVRQSLWLSENIAFSAREHVSPAYTRVPEVKTRAAGAHCRR